MNKIISITAVFFLIATVAFSIPRINRPDLVVHSITYSPSNPYDTDDIIITAVVKNIGNRPARASKLLFKIGGETTGVVYDIEPLRPGSTRQWKRQFSPSRPDTYRVLCVADYRNHVRERNERNNNKAIYIKVNKSDKPDLTVYSITHSPNNPTTDDLTHVRFKVANIGKATARNFIVRYKVGGGAYKETTVHESRPGHEFTIVHPVRLTVAQPYLATAIADADGVVEESREDNNRKTHRFIVTEAGGGTPPPPKPSPTPHFKSLKPDLIISSLTYTPGNPYTTDNIIFTAVVKNVGNATAPESKMMLKVGGEGSPPHYAIESLSPGATRQWKRSVNLSSAGSYITTAQADVESDVAESNEGNNIKTLSFSVAEPGKPDLMVKSISITPTNPTTEDRIHIKVVYKNIGDATAGRFKTSFRVGGESSPSVATIHSMRPDHEISAHRTVELGVAQRYRITFIVDVDDEQDEKDETNNTRTFDFTVVNP